MEAERTGGHGSGQQGNFGCARRVTRSKLTISPSASRLRKSLRIMHSGKGGGLSDMFGGSVGSAAAGSTVVEKNLDRITVTVAVIFAFTNLILILRLQ